MQQTQYTQHPPPPGAKPPQQPLLILRILWLSLTASTGTYFVILKQMPPRGSASTPNLLVPLATVSVVLWFMSFIIPDFVLKSTKRRQTGPMSPAQTVQAYTVPLILRLALAEAVCVNGFVLAIMTGDPAQYYPFWIAGLIPMILAFPEQTKIDAKFQSS